MILTGALVDAILACAGGILGLIFRRHVSRDLGEFLLIGQGLVCILLGIQGMIGYHSDICVITLSMGFGFLIGFAFNIDSKITHFAIIMQDSLARVAQKFSGKAQTNATSSEDDSCAHTSFSSGFICASVFTCTGAMAIIGSLQSGMQLDHSTLLAKGFIDMISCFAFGASMGKGVPFCALSVFIYEGCLSVLAHIVSPYLSTEVINNVVASGSLLLIVVGFNLMKVGKFKVANMLPAAFLPIIFVPLIAWFSSLL